MALCAAIFWGTFFPLISELFTGDKASLAAPWFDRYTTPLAILLVLFTGIGPLLAWRRVSWASAKRVFLRAGDRRRARPRSSWRSFTDAARKPWALALFVFAAFALAGLAQEFWRGAAARRSLAGGSMPAALVGGRLPQPPPLRRLHRPRRGRRAADRDRRLLQLPDQPRRDACGPGRAPSSTAARSPTSGRPSASTARRFTFGAVLGVEQDGKPFTLLHPSRRFFRPTGVQTGTIGSFFDGEATSEVGLKAGLGSDFWTAVQPEHHRACSAGRGRPTAASAPASAAPPGRRRSARRCRRLMRAAAANPRLRPAALAQIDSLQAATAERIATSYLADGAPATFRVIVNPLVTWMWIGGLIALAGALIAIWPARGARRAAGRRHRARGAEGGQVPRDPRRRARPRRRQALRRGLRAARRRAAHARRSRSSTGRAGTRRPARDERLARRRLRLSAPCTRSSASSR